MIFQHMLHNFQLFMIRVELNIIYLIKNEYPHISYIIHLANMLDNLDTIIIHISNLQQLNFFQGHKINKNLYLNHISYNI